MGILIDGVTDVNSNTVPHFREIDDLKRHREVKCCHTWTVILISPVFSTWVQWVCVPERRSAGRGEQQHETVGREGCDGVHTASFLYIEPDTWCVATMAFLHAYVPFSIAEMWWRRERDVEPEEVGADGFDVGRHVEGGERDFGVQGKRRRVGRLR